MQKLMNIRNRLSCGFKQLMVKSKAFRPLSVRRICILGNHGYIVRTSIIKIFQLFGIASLVPFFVATAL